MGGRGVSNPQRSGDCGEPTPGLPEVSQHPPRLASGCPRASCPVSPDSVASLCPRGPRQLHARQNRILPTRGARTSPSSSPSGMAG